MVSSSLSSKPADIFDGKNPGQIALTLMLYLPHSAASARVKLIAAALEVLYAIVFMPGGEPFNPATDAMLIILPARRGIMLRLPTSRATKNGAWTFRFITLCHASS